MTATLWDWYQTNPQRFGWSEERRETTCQPKTKHWKSGAS